MEIPAYRSDLRAKIITSQISYKPTLALFRDKNITVRIEEPSFNKRMQEYGFDARITDLECLIVLKSDEEPPEERKDDLIIDNERYEITEVSKDSGDYCYLLTLRKKGKLK